MYYVFSMNSLKIIIASLNDEHSFNKQDDNINTLLGTCTSLKSSKYMYMYMYTSIIITYIHYIVYMFIRETLINTTS